MKITKSMVDEFNGALNVLHCSFKLKLSGTVEAGNTQCDIVPANDIFIKTSIINPTEEFYTILGQFFEGKGIPRLHFNNTRSTFWSVDGWD